MRTEPTWIDRVILDAIHHQLLQTFGGSSGVRDDNLIEAALARPVHKWAYTEPALAELAAAYAFGLIKDHGYVDGNKRVGAAVMAVFLDLNGFELETPEPELVAMIEGIADGSISEEQLAIWLRKHVRPKPKKPRGRT